MNKTNISWTSFSANPLKYRRKSDGAVVWACVKTSPGCAACYAEALALRYERGKLFNSRNMEELEPFIDEKELHEMLTRRTCGGQQVSGSRVFIADMTDLFGEWVPFELIDRIMAVIALRRDVTFQVLTKRAERMREYMTAQRPMCLHEVPAGQYARLAGPQHPLPNLHLGVSVESQQYADERIPHLLQTPAAVRWVSAEPLLGAIDLSIDETVQFCNACCAITPTLVQGKQRFDCGACGDPRTRERCYLDYLDWLVVGGESGTGYRDCDPAWIADIARQCQAAGVPVWVKQDAHRRPGQQGRIPDDVWAMKQLPEAQTAR